ncbi:hypothetical protein LCGC14_0394430 [marine sediment metagenome]|uniref:Uncharacterized protein n=1 Tax=marine sediment metagenome TaxID=412755 RepID=A0A0F9W7S3_9ZZZZ
MTRLLFVLLLLLPSTAWGQPELKVGQEVKWDCNTCVYEGNGLYRCTAMLCLGSAPRPEFKLPEYIISGVTEGVMMINDEAIADELRWLRERIEQIEQQVP